MATKSRNTSLTRLSRIGLALGIGSIQATGSNNSQREDDSYIPYHGPYESPTRGQEIRGYWDNGTRDTTLDTYSFSRLLLDGGKTQASVSSNGRRYSDASKVTLSKVMTEPRRRFSRVRQNSTPQLKTSYVSLDQGGGIGDTPVPAHRSTASHSRSSSKRRDSVFRASMTDLRKSFSKAGSRHGKTRQFGASFNDHVSQTTPSPHPHKQASLRSRSNSAVVRQRHPYATASSHLEKAPFQPNPQSRKGDHATPSQKKVPAHLKPTSRASLLKTSLSTPDLHSASLQPYVKTKTRWLSAETWCDAFMFPRPRFLLRHLEDIPTTPTRQLLSPAESVVSGQAEAFAEPKLLKKSLSVSEIRAPNIPRAIPNPALKNGASKSRAAPRPRSFAFDDLALPSPIPSLSTVLADKQNLQDERQMWQERATNSFGNKRTRSLSRSKSLGKTRKPSYRQTPTGNFDFLVERTLLGHQAIPSTVHTMMNPSTTPMQTVSGGGQTTRSFASAFPVLRSKSLGHSKSVGTTRDRPGHMRMASVPSVLHCAKSTATGFCAGANGTSTPPDALDTFTEKSDAKVLTPSDRQQGMTDPRSVDLVTPPTGQTRISPDRGFLVSPRQGPPVSSTPSSCIQLDEGVGIAISSPLPPEEHLNDELITFPAHPYAQGVDNHHPAPAKWTSPSETMQYRQPIVHPYAIHSAHPATLSPQWVRRDQSVSPARRMFAEVVPGRLREIHPEEIQYSPFIEDAPAVFTNARDLYLPGVTGRQSADSTSRRDSDVLRMGDALNLVRNRQSSSTESGVGTSEDLHLYGPQPDRTLSSRLNTFPLPQVNEILDVVDDDDDEGTSNHQWLELSATLPRVHNVNSDPTSPHPVPSGQLNPPVFIGPPTPMGRMEPSGSSPGLSNDSSPPLTPRPLGRLDDLERFQDLFYNPSANQPGYSPVPVPVTEPEDQGPASSPVLTRNRSQLTTLVRQLNEDLNELRNEEHFPDDGDPFEGLNHEHSRGPTTWMSGSSWSDGSSSILGSTHLFLSTLPPLHPLDQPVLPSRENFPEDVQSEVSSLSDRIPEEDYNEITETLRVGNVEAVSTPPPVGGLRRESGHVALVDNTMSLTTRAIPPSGATLPSADLARSSHLTIDSGGSRISGLSAFPRPPSEQSADILASYFSQERDDDDMPELISAALQSPVSPTGESQGEWTHSP